ncbi:pyruvate carboxylase subunit B [Puniceicoccaceae bacterium K14]|nr:pyruvate carboxylase subunit B [Puniceicoccaceae bacterium K14]
MKNSPVVFNNNVLRDGHQSLAATRMRTEQMLPILELLDSVGFGCLETWGGATIDAGLRFLNEFPFDRLDAIRTKTKSRHMMLLRGQNIVGYKHFPDDVVNAFINTSSKHGMDVFRIFDALNDPRNMQAAIAAANAAGKEAQGVICYTSSPVHTTDAFIKLGIELQELGCGSICLKDMAGLVPPKQAYEIVKGLKKQIKIPVVLHTHETAGLGATTYYAAIEAGVDALDTSIIPFANGTGQPDTSRMLSLLEGHSRKPDYNLDKLQQLREHFEKIYQELSSFTNPANERVDSDTLKYQVPGGMLSNFRNQLKEQKMEDKFEDVFREIPVVREALGWIPLVTPTSQIVGVQAMLNVKFGRWKNFSPQAMDIALGYYGRTPAPVNPEVTKIAAEKSGKDPITCRPADLQDPGMETLRKELSEANMPSDDEHCVIHAMFPQELAKYHKSKTEPKAKPTSTPPATSSLQPTGKSRNYSISINGKNFQANVEELSA